jgi:hypothetical protein
MTVEVGELAWLILDSAAQDHTNTPEPSGANCQIAVLPNSMETEGAPGQKNVLIVIVKNKDRIDICPRTLPEADINDMEKVARAVEPVVSDFRWLLVNYGDRGCETAKHTPSADLILENTGEGWAVSPRSTIGKDRIGKLLDSVSGCFANSEMVLPSD